MFQFESLLQPLRRLEELEGELKGQAEQATRRAEELAALNAIATVINQSLDLDLILNDALDAVLAVLEAEGGQIRLLDEATDELVLVVERGRSGAFVGERARLRWEESCFASLRMNSEALVITDLEEAARESPAYALALAEGYRSYAALPLAVQGRVVGTLSVLSRTTGKFQGEEVQFLTAIGQQIGVAIERARLYEEERRNAARLAALLEITAAINSQLHSQGVLQLIIDKAVEVLGAEKGILYLLDEADRRLKPVAWHNLSVAIEEFIIQVGESATGRAVLWRRPIAIPDTEADTEHEVRLHITQREGTRAFLSLPLIAKDRVVGAMTIAHTLPHHFSQEEISTATLFASQAALALENAHVYQKTQRYAVSLEQLYKASIQVGASLDLDETLRFIVRSAVEATDAASSNLVLFEESGRVSQLAVWDPSGALEEKLHIRPTGISRKVVETGKLWMLPHFAEAPPGLVNPDLIRAGRQAAICLPLQFKDRVGGVMWIHYDTPKTFTEDEIHLLSSFATQAALAVEHAELFKATQKKAAQLEALFETTKLLASTYELTEALRLLAEMTVRVTEAAGCVIFSVDEDKGGLTLKAASGEDALSTGGWLLDDGVISCLCLQVVEENRPLIIGDLEQQMNLFDQYFRQRCRFRSLLLVPIQIRGRVLGVVAAFFASPLPSFDEAIDLTSTIAHLAAIAIEDTRLLSRSALLQEVHHRVKNNLQTVAGLLYLQLNHCRPKAATTALEESINRIKSIAAVHDLLSLDNLGLTRIKELLQKIVELSLVDGGGHKKVQVIVEGSDLFLPSREATSLALIINELVSNAVRHGFKGRKKGKVVIRILADVGVISIEVEDDGIGLPPSFDMERDANLGLKIVESIARKDLNGGFSIASDGKTTARVTFPWSEEAVARGV